MPSVPKLGSVFELPPADSVLVRGGFGLGDGGTRSVASVAWFEVLQKKPLPRVAKVLRRPPPFERRVPRTWSCIGCRGPGPVSAVRVPPWCRLARLGATQARKKSLRERPPPPARICERPPRLALGWRFSPTPLCALLTSRGSFRSAR